VGCAASPAHHFLGNRVGRRFVWILAFGEDEDWTFVKRWEPLPRVCTFGVRRRVAAFPKRDASRLTKRRRAGALQGAKPLAWREAVGAASSAENPSRASDYSPKAECRCLEPLNLNDRRGGPMCPPLSRLPWNQGVFSPATRAHTRRVRPYTQKCTNSRQAKPPENHASLSIAPPDVSSGVLYFVDRRLRDFRAAAPLKESCGVGRSWESGFKVNESRATPFRPR